MGFFQSIGNFFKRLFGGKPKVEATAPEHELKPTKPPVSAPAPEPEPESQLRTKQSDAGRVILTIERVRIEGDSIQGKVTLEGSPVGLSLEYAPDALDAGTYPLSLRKAGGLHATYGYRYPNMHEGLIRIGKNFAYLRTGAVASDSKGGIILAESVEEQGPALEAWHSDQAYRKVYPRLKAMLLDGERIAVEIKG